MTSVPGLKIGPGDDAGVFCLDSGTCLVETVDIITPVVDDPIVFGKIAATNALSDIYSMGAVPKTALVILGFDPCESSKEEVQAILAGVVEVLGSAGVALTGGHTLEDRELKVGLAVTGVADEEKILTSSGASAGQVLVLTKPLGTGVLSTALKGGKLSMEDLQEAIKWMTTLNDRASKAALEANSSACTDVTGFGLLGHAYNMLRGSALELVIETAHVPFMKGVIELASSGIIPEGAYRNYEFIKDRVRFSRMVKEIIRLLLCDPQTSGGLLVATHPDSLGIFDRHRVNYHVIGHFRKGQGTITVV